MANPTPVNAPEVAAPAFLKPRRTAARRGAAAGPVLALDWDNQTLRVARAGGRDSLEGVWTTPLDWPADADRTDPGVVGATLGRALARLEIKPGPFVLGVARARVVLRKLRVPPVAKEPELTSLIHLQVARDLPFPAEEAVIDYQVERAAAPAGGDAAGVRWPVLVAVVRREVVEFYARVAVAAGGSLTGLGLGPAANARGRRAGGGEGAEGVTALVTLRGDEVGVDIAAGGRLVFSRGAPVAAGAALVPTAVTECVRSLHAYGGAEPGAPVARLVVAGGTGEEAALVAALHGRVAAPAEVWPAAGLPAGSAGLIGVIGLALGAKDEAGLPFDFWQPKAPAVRHNLARLRLLIGGAVAVTGLVAALTAREVLLRRRLAVLAGVNVELADAEKKRPIYRTLLGHATVVGDWVHGGRDWLRHLAYLSAVLPGSEEIYLTAVSVDPQGVIRLAVQARSGETLARLDQQLRAAGYDVKPVAINPGANRFGYDFRSNVELTPTAKLKLDLARVKPPARRADDASLDPRAWKRGGQ